MPDSGSAEAAVSVKEPLPPGRKYTTEPEAAVLTKPLKKSCGVVGAVLSTFASADGCDAAETLPTLSVALAW